MHPSFYLSDEEIADLCAPLVQPAAQVRYLQRMGLTVAKKPNGRPVVVRSHAEAVLSGNRLPPISTPSATAGSDPKLGPGPDIQGLRNMLAARRNQRKA